MGHRHLDSLDQQIIRLLAKDARMPFLEIARKCNVSGAAIHQRVQKLHNLGILKGSEYVIDPEKIGYETCAYIGIFLKDPEDFDHVVEELKKIPEVVECIIPPVLTICLSSFMPRITAICSRLFTTSCSP